MAAKKTTKRRASGLGKKGTTQVKSKRLKTTSGFGNKGVVIITGLRGGSLIDIFGERTGKKQTNKGLIRDKKRLALGAGKRRSRKGNVYYETRKNRSDVGTSKGWL